MKCPVCFSILTDDPPAYAGPPPSNLRFEDETIWWCAECQEYYTEEDFLFTMED